MADHKLTIEITWCKEGVPPIVQAGGNPPDWFRYAWIDEMIDSLPQPGKPGTEGHTTPYD